MTDDVAKQDAFGVDGLSWGEPAVEKNAEENLVELEHGGLACLGGNDPHGQVGVSGKVVDGRDERARMRGPTGHLRERVTSLAVCRSMSAVRSSSRPAKW